MVRLVRERRVGAVTFLIVATTMLGTAVPAVAGNKTAAFITGTYVMEGRCGMLAKIEAGGPKNVETTPETLTSKGFETWEGGCTFLSIKQKTKGRVWVARMACAEEAEESVETDRFELDPKDQSITVTVDGEVTKYIHCDAAKGN